MRPDILAINSRYGFDAIYPEAMVYQAIIQGEGMYYNISNELCQPEIYVDKVPSYEVLELRDHTIESIARLLGAESWTIKPPRAKKQTKKQIEEGAPYQYTKLKVFYHNCTAVNDGSKITVNQGEFVVVERGIREATVVPYAVFYQLFERKILR